MPNEAQEGTLAWLLQQAVEHRQRNLDQDHKKLEHEEREPRVEQQQRQWQLERSLQHLRRRTNNLANLDSEDHLPRHGETGLARKLQEQCTVVEALRKSLADEFGRLSSSSSSYSESVFSPKTPTSDFQQKTGTLHFLNILYLIRVIQYLTIFQTDT